MQKSRAKLFKTFFSHIYIEREAFNHPRTKKVLEKYPNAEIVEINHYKDLFSRSRQNYGLQKESPKIILAVKKEHLIYEGAPVCENFGHYHFYYTSTMMNCIYDCEYCYLQGMYTSANIVIFINIEDIFRKVEKLLENHSVYLCISYDTDILAFENVIGYAREWINFAKEHKNLEIELRTKSANFKAIEDLDAQDNIILAWTLSPAELIKSYENKTPSLKARLFAIKSAINKGWKVRVCLDPLLYIKEWKESYKNLIETTFTELPAQKIYDVSIGVFRVSKDYLKIMRRQRPNSIIVNYPFETINGVCSYDETISESMVNYVLQLIKKYIPEERVYY